MGDGHRLMVAGWLQAWLPFPSTLIWLGRWTAAAAVFLVLVAVWTFYCYVREGRPSMVARAAFTLLRVAAAAALLALLFEPTLRTERVERSRSIVAVLVDCSDSMALRDRWTDPGQRRAIARWAGVSDPAAFARLEWVRRALGVGHSGVQGAPPRRGGPRRSGAERKAAEHMSAAGWLRRLGQTHEVRFYAFGGDRRATNLAGLRATPRVAGDATRLGDAVATTLDEYTGQPLAGIVLLSDGGSNMGQDPVTAGARAAERRVPIFTVGIGDPVPPRDLSVASLLVDDVVRKGDEVTVDVGLKQSGLAGRTTRVILRQDGRELGAQTVQLASAGRQELEFRYRPDQAGAHVLEVSALPLPDEVSRVNNARGARVRVVEKRLKVLYLEGSPRWEYRYLKNAILRDPGIRFACLLMDSEPSGGGEGNVKIVGFPSGRKQLFDYDIVILGDVARSNFSDAQLHLLRAFVEERGGSLVVIAGEAHMPWEYRGSPLEALLPAIVPAGRQDHSVEEPFVLKLTEAGRRQPMLQLEPDPAANARRWESLPGSYWCGTVGHVKPGATVLLETGDGSRVTNDGGTLTARHSSSVIREASFPLVLIQPVGEGMTLLSLLDSTWRWRFRLGDTYFYRYWGQVLRTMTPHELPGDNRLVKLTVDRESYRPGERVVLRARVLTPTFHPVRVTALTAGVTRDDGTRTAVRLSSLAGSPGVYTGEWTPPRSGKYRIALQAPTGGAPAEATFAVEGTSLEQQDPEMNRDLLQRVARASGGAYLELGELDRLPRRIPDRSERHVTRTERPLWDAPLPLAVFSVLLVGEWVLRKRSGLL